MTVLFIWFATLQLHSLLLLALAYPLSLPIVQHTAVRRNMASKPRTPVTLQCCPCLDQHDILPSLQCCDSP
jgi:hypothetical protein